MPSLLDALTVVQTRKFATRPPSSRVVYEDRAVREWLRREGFVEGDLRSAKAEFPCMHPMGHACYRGELNVCKWLFDHGAAEDITTLNNNGESPMLLSCEWGHLPVCEWLFEVGASKHITKVDNLRRSPIYWASTRGHLKVMQWLFDKGAAADISRSIFGGATPMYMACRAGRMSVCQWLGFNGAMNRRAAARKIHYRNDDDDDDDDDEIENESIGHADEKVVQLDTAHDNGKHRLALLAWAQSVTDANAAFRRTFLFGTISAATTTTDMDAYQRRRGPSTQHLPMLNEQGPAFSRMFKERIAGFVGGVETGRRLRNVREFADALVALGVRAGAGE